VSADVLVLLQARMGSARLPGKSLMPIVGRSLVAHCVTRLERAASGCVVVATTALAEDDPLAAEAAALGVRVFRGDAPDVLGRMSGAAASSDARFVIRATGDNPAVDPDSVERLLAVMAGGAFDHAVEEGLPSGATVEAMTAEALRAAAVGATSAYDREHVTPYIRRESNGFRCAVVPALRPLRRPDLRFTVDTRADLDYMRRVFRRAGASHTPHLSLAELIAAADAVARPDAEVA
jgi:spore coat polysaccharide biosynthesis protein SpsF (cytidylyltransferase family)